MKTMRVSLAVAIGVSLITAGCTTVTDPAVDAEVDRQACVNYGHKQGTANFAACRQQLAQTRQTNRERNKIYAQAAIGQSLVVGAALVGAAAVVASTPTYYRPYPYYYYHCNYWGCW